MSRLRLVLFSFLFGLVLLAHGKFLNPDSFPETSTNNYWRNVFDNRFQTIGLGYGLDNFWFGVHYQTSYPIVTIGKTAKEARRSRTYTGAFIGTRFHLFGLFALWGGADLNAGLSLGPLTVEQNINWNFLTGEGGSSSMLNSSFKMGIHVRPIWLKMGVNVWTSKPDASWLDIVAINKRLLVFSVLFRFDEQ